MIQKLKAGELRPGEELSDVRLEHATVYRVIGNTDNVEGRGASITLGWFFKRIDATEFAEGRGVFGSKAGVVPSMQWILRYKACTIQDSREVIHLIGDEVATDYVDPGVLRKRALAKLSPEDMEILGLTDK